MEAENLKIVRNLSEMIITGFGVLELKLEFQNLL